MKKLVMVYLITIIATSLVAQVHEKIQKDEISTSTDLAVLAKKGNKVYISSADTFSVEGLGFLKEGLVEFDYWTIVDSPDNAQFIIELKCRKEQKMTVVAIYSVGSFINANGEVVFKTNEFKGTPTAFNGYNSFSGSVAKMIDKGFRKKFK